MAQQLAKAIRSLDYPDDRLDVKLLLEEDDIRTRAALLSEDWPGQTEILVLPDGRPRTKPRALNVGLARSTGQFVVVYDAEDRPDPSQLKSAASAFLANTDLACVQAPLVGCARTWLGAQWSLEYAIQFGRVLPALGKLNLPIALGGTSNHFRRTTLDAVGGWDAWNVTEDADLGLRLARERHRVDVILPPTFEKAPDSVRVWISQRSRWLKGFMQTWLVMMRSPGQAIDGMGLSGFISTQLILGGSILSAIAHLPWLLYCCACFLHPEWSLSSFAVSILVFTYASGVALALLAPGRIDIRRWLSAITLPAYWPLQSIAMYRAIISLIRTPHFWAKTPHYEDDNKKDLVEIFVHDTFR